MLSWLRRLLGTGRAPRRRARSVASPLPAPVQVSRRDNFETLRTDFQRQTYEFEYYRNGNADIDPRLLHWVGSVDHAGYVRERCLRWLIAHFEPGDENRILLRLGDWVPQVRAVARDWVLAHFADLPQSAIRENQRLLLLLSRKEGLVGDPAMECIEADLLSRAGAIPDAEFFSFETLFRRYLYHLSLGRDQALRGRIQIDPDPSNRKILLRDPRCRPLAPGELARFASDRAASVRRKLLFLRIEQGEPPGREELTSLSLDRNRGVRDVGRFYLKQLHGIDASDLYRESSGPEFYYIADLARREDIPHFHEGLQASGRATRLNCLRALVRADRRELAKLDLHAVLARDPSARKILRPYLHGLLSADAIIELRPVLVGERSTGLLGYLRILELNSWWRFFEVALEELLRDPSPELQGIIRGAISSKSELYDQPSAALRDRIRDKLDALDAADHPADPRLRRTFEFALR